MAWPFRPGRCVPPSRGARLHADLKHAYASDIDALRFSYLAQAKSLENMGGSSFLDVTPTTDSFYSINKCPVCGMGPLRTLFDKSSGLMYCEDCGVNIGIGKECPNESL